MENNGTVLPMMPSRDVSGRGEDAPDVQVVLGMLHHATTELARVNAEMDLLVQAVSHDLHEPLRMVNAYAQLLARRYAGQLDAEADDFLTFVSDGAQRMHGLTEDLLAYGAAGRSPLRRGTCDSAAVLELVLAQLAPAIAESGASVIAQGMPQVVADPEALSRLFFNLLDNAIRYRHPARPPFVQVVGTEVESGWHFRVTDNGLSLPVGEVDRIFMVFQRLHGSEMPGSGLGLSICKRIVERHGGRIWAEPHEDGVGATFHFTLLRLL